MAISLTDVSIDVANSVWNPVINESVTAVNFDQVDLTWTPSSTSMTLVERAEAEVGPYVTEAWDEVGVSSRRLNNHLPSTTYYYRIRRVSVGGVVTETVNLGSVTTPAATRTLYVSKVGSDLNDGLTLANAFLNINKFHTIAQPGDICYIKAGTYFEDAEAYNVTYGGLVLSDTGAESTMMQTQINGTEALPIVVRAYPGDETLVTFDGQVGTVTFDAGGTITDSGIAVRGVKVNNDHWHFYGLEIKDMLGSGIGCGKNTPNDTFGEENVLDFSNCVSYCIVENCWVHGINSQTGTNSACVAPWGGRGWVIRNLRLDDSYQATGTRGNGIQWYGALDMHIENVKITNAENCVQMKDHYITSINPRSTGFECDIFACDFDGRDNGVSVAQRGATSNESGAVTTRHSIIKAANTAVYWNPSANIDPTRQSNTIGVSNCTLWGVSGRDLIVRNSLGASLYGNIFITGDVRFSHYSWDVSSWETRLLSSNYNAFNSSTFNYGVDTGTPYEVEATTLSAWQASLNQGYVLTFDNPDLNSSASATGTLVNDEALGDYTNPSSGAAFETLADSSNAGAYRFGAEIIGLLPTFYWGDSL